jgi:hypothetical protein
MPKAKRLKPTPETLREIFLKSGNLCAFPGCMSLMMNREGVFIGQVCHIEAAEEGGERFNTGMTEEDRRAFGNLMLMCYEHHAVTNDVVAYPVPTLQSMKADHEARFTNAERSIETIEEARQSILQQGDGNRAVAIGRNTGTIIQGDTHHYHGHTPPEQSFQPTAAEAEILIRLAESHNKYLNAVKYDGGFEVLIDGNPLGGESGRNPFSVELGEAVRRLLEFGLLTDIQFNKQIYHLSTKGRDVARKIRQLLDSGILPDFGELERRIPELLREMREDYAKLPLMREIVLLEFKGVIYNGDPVLVYYRDTHEQLDNMFAMLDNMGLVSEITFNNVKRFRVTERFARYLIEGK